MLLLGTVEDVLGLEVAVHDVVLVQVPDGLEDLAWGVAGRRARQLEAEPVRSS